MAMENLVIRSATTADADHIYRFVCGLSEKSFNAAIFKQHYETNLGSDRNYYFVAEVNGIVSGFISCQGQLLLHHNDWVYEIQELYVDSAYRSLGIGQKLLQHLEATLAGMTYDILEVSSNNMRKDAHRFYLSNGFGQTHTKFTKKP